MTQARFRILAIVLGSFAAGCIDTAPPPPEIEPGLYELVNIDGRGLPTGHPCGGYTVRYGALSLGRDRSAGYLLRYQMQGSTDEVTYTASGFYGVVNGVVEIDVVGGWSNQNQTQRSRRVFHVVDEGLEQQNVGVECDASATELYDLRGPLGAAEPG